MFMLLYFADLQLDRLSQLHARKFFDYRRHRFVLIGGHCVQFEFLLPSRAEFR